MASNAAKGDDGASGVRIFYGWYIVIVADLFGRKSFSSVYKYLVLFMVLEAVGFVIMGLSFDLTGSYDSAFLGYIVTCLIASGLVFSVWRPTANPGP